jgi:lysyl-tRNA synthetase class 2
VIFFNLFGVSFVMDNDLVKSKKDNLRKLRDKSINPYPYKFGITAFSTDLAKKFSSLKNEEYGPEFGVAGRVMAKRSFGAIAFLKVADAKGAIQFFMRKGESPQEVFDLMEFIDLGDIVGGKGKIYRTQRGELSIMVSSLEVLCKTILPLPEKFHGLQDIELRQRKRYLDLIMNPEVREVFVKRSKIISAWREFIDSKGFLEVETPVLQPTYGGANARPFTTVSNAWKSTFYLSISPELYLKRLLVGGFEKVYSVCKNFRNEDVDKTHNPEFTMSEYYWAYADLNDIISLTEQMVEFIALKVNGSTKITYEGKEIDFKAPWKRINLVEALNMKLGRNVMEMDLEELLSIARKEKIEINLDEQKWGLVVAKLFEHFCESELVQPTWVLEHPKETTPLCKPSRVNPERLIERTEGYVNGHELCNGYSELNDPILQKVFFEEQKDQGKAKGEQHPIDEDFLEAMGYGMPPAAGMGLGLDRIVMLLTNSSTIRDVIFFPQMRPEKKE